MINLLQKMDWSDEFLLPLTGLSKNNEFRMRSYLFWDKNTINDYKLILTLNATDYEKMLSHCREVVFPLLDKGGYLLENYDVDHKSIFILDMSIWSSDIRHFINGKYSQMSTNAKTLIEKYHTFDGYKISIQTLAVLYPSRQFPLLDNITPIEYVAKNYGLNLDEIKKIGEIGSLFNKVSETLTT